MLRDYSKAFEDCALYLPSVQPPYARFAHSGEFKRKMPIEPRQLNFLDDQSCLFYYPNCLYSAGVAAKSDASAKQTDDIVFNRDRSKTFCVCDSGGFQISTEAIPWEGNITVERMLGWMEARGDYCMALDFPTKNIGNGVIEKHTKALIDDCVDLVGFNKRNRLSLDYNACLYLTDENNRAFTGLKASPSTKFVNVMQGRNERESKVWYEAMKGYPFSGWSFAGIHTRDLALTLARILDMKSDGFLKDCEIIHFLGNTTLHLGCMYTAIKRAIKRAWGYDIAVTYDGSNPFSQIQFGTIYTGFILSRYGWCLLTDKLPRHAGGYQHQKFQDYCSECAREELDNKEQRFIKRDKHLSRRVDVYGSPLAHGASLFEGQSTIASLLNFDQIEDSLLFNSVTDPATGHLAINHNLHVVIDAHRWAQTAFRQKHVDQVPPELLLAEEAINYVLDWEHISASSHFCSHEPDPYVRLKNCAKLLDFT